MMMMMMIFISLIRLDTLLISHFETGEERRIDGDGSREYERELMCEYVCVCGDAANRIYC